MARQEGVQTLSAMIHTPTAAVFEQELKSVQRMLSDQVLVSQDRCVDALLDLYREGNLGPGTDELLQRSGVSRRSLFRYFDDLNDLCRAAIARQIARASHLIAIQGIGVGPLDGRISRLVTQRADLYDAIAPAAKVGRAGAEGGSPDR